MGPAGLGSGGRVGKLRQKRCLLVRLQAAAIEPQPPVADPPDAPAAAARAAPPRAFPTPYRRVSRRPTAADRPARRRSRSGRWQASTATGRSGQAARNAGSRRPAVARMSASGRVSRRSVGRRSASRSGSRYSRNTASSAASRPLSSRSARFSGLALTARDQVGAADDQPGLRTAEQLVAGKCHEIDAGERATLAASARAAGPSARGRSGCREPRSSISGRSAAWAMAARSGGGDGGGEAGDRVVGLMHPHQQRRSPGRSRSGSRA